MSQSLFHSIIAGLLLVVLMFAHAIGVLSPVLDLGNAGTDILSRPFSRILSDIRNIFTIVFSVKDLYVQNDILSDQVRQLSMELASLEQATAENKILQEALGFREESARELIAARIITFDPLQPDRTAIINRGSADGVETGDSIVISEGILVGSVVAVSRNSSQFEPITSSSISINAQTASAGATGIVKGEHGLGLLFDLISQNSTVQSGERVITSGLGGIYPSGLLIGTVNEIRSPESELFQKASVVPAAPLRNLRIVFVLKYR